MSLLASLDPWLGHLIIGIYLVALMLFGGIVLAKARQSPLWVFLLLVPYVSVVAVYVFAFVRWPGYDGEASRDGHGRDGPARRETRGG